MVPKPIPVDYFLKTLRNEFGKHKNWYFPNFVNNSPKNLPDHESLEEDRLENLWNLSKQTSQATKRRQFLSLFMKKIRWPRLYVFLLKKFKAWILKKFRLLFWPSFSTEAIKIRFFSIFCFASFDSFKALTGCLKTFKIYRNDLVFKKICPSPVLRLECLFRCYSFYTLT